jgi:peroxiredoxin
MTTGQAATSLQDQLDAFKVQLAGMVPPEVVATIGDDTAALLRSGIAAGILQVGERAPDFALPGATGATVRLGDLLARGPVVVAFYRGDWCPYCNLMLRAYQAIQPELAALGATLVAISPQTPDHSLTTAEKRGLRYLVLSDVGNAVARRYGLVFAVGEAARATYAAIGAGLPAFNGDDSWELPVPGTFVLDRAGTVHLAFADPDFTRRLEPAALLAAVRALGER